MEPPVFLEPAGEPAGAVSPEAAAPLGALAPLAPADPPVVESRDLDWAAIRTAVQPGPIHARMSAVVQSMEALFGTEGGPKLMFDVDRENPADKAIHIATNESSVGDSPVWIVGDLHGDLLALEASLALIRREHGSDGAPPRIVFLGDFIDDEGLAVELLVRVFELILAAPESVCVIAGNHDEALSYDGTRFASTVSPSDFSAFLNANLADEWIRRTGQLAIRLTAQAPRALFFPDGLLVSHGGFPLVDLHPALFETGDWNAPACLADFTWSRAHPKARRKLPNRFAKGSQFGYEDFADFCALSAELGRPITHLVRGHDHVEERYAIYPAYHAHPVLTTVALSRRLNRESFGPYERAPTLVRIGRGSLPQVHRLFPPKELIHEVFPPVEQGTDAGTPTSGEVPA